MLLASGRSIPEIAPAIKRSQEATRGRAWKIGLLKVRQPGPAKKAGDATANPLPDNPDQCGGSGSGDAGRTS